MPGPSGSGPKIVPSNPFLEIRHDKYQDEHQTQVVKTLRYLPVLFWDKLKSKFELVMNVHAMGWEEDPSVDTQQARFDKILKGIEVVEGIVKKNLLMKDREGKLVNKENLMKGERLQFREDGKLDMSNFKKFTVTADMLSNFTVTVGGDWNTFLDGSWNTGSWSIATGGWANGYGEDKEGRKLVGQRHKGTIDGFLSKGH